MAEAVAEVLSRYLPAGVAIEATEIAPDLDGEGIPVGPLRVRGFIPVDSQLDETRQKIEEGLWYLGRIRSLPAPEYNRIENVNWMETWKEHYRPIPIGERLIIIPAWMESPDRSRVPIRIDPGMAFGTGTHPSTQLCLGFVEDRVRPGKAVIDVGCGSGILSIAALKLGASQALAVDIDPQAVMATRVNAQTNGVLDRMILGVGSVDEIRAGQFPLQSASLVLANILAPVLVRLLDSGLGDLVLPGGDLILAGILRQQWEDTSTAPSPLQDSLRRHGLVVREVRQEGDWVAVNAGRLK
jgi:ribosomal protein L11 methyltransferase